MRAARGPRLVVAGVLSVMAALFLGAGVAAAQTSTTVPPIPVTGSTTATTAAPASGTASSSKGLASTGIAADMLVPLGFGLIGLGGVMQVAARRPRRDLGLL